MPDGMDAKFEMLARQLSLWQRTMPSQKDKSTILKANPMPRSTLLWSISRLSLTRISNSRITSKQFTEPMRKVVQKNQGCELWTHCLRRSNPTRENITKMIVDTRKKTRADLPPLTTRSTASRFVHLRPDRTQALPHRRHQRHDRLSRRISPLGALLNGLMSYMPSKLREWSTSSNDFIPAPILTTFHSLQRPRLSQAQQGAIFTHLSPLETRWLDNTKRLP